jgi:hypothetical protein
MAWSVGGLNLLLLAAGVFWAWSSGRVRLADRPSDVRQEADELARRIALLDDRNALGELSTESWQQQRSQLKARLMELTVRLQSAATE